MARSARIRENDDSLAIRAAWLHYAGGLRQAEVAQRLGITGVKAHRLIMRATEAGAVKVSIAGPVAECVELEAALGEKFGLTYCEVVPDIGEDTALTRALAIAGAGFIQRAIEAREAQVIGVGHGRTLAGAIAEMPHVDAAHLSFVSLLGGLTRNFAANPHDVIHRLAEKTGAAAYVMPVPFVANSVEDREVLLAQRGIAEVQTLAHQADLMLVGIGTTEADTQLIAARMVEPGEMTDIKARGGAGEILGHFFDAEGQVVETPLSDRTLSLAVDRLKGRKVVAIAGGAEKTGAIRSVLMSGLLSGLITDERSAYALVKGTAP
ncbi:MAG: sugar-binding transcriptional regulator [Pseudorhodobacter sp.]